MKTIQQDLEIQNKYVDPRSLVKIEKNQIFIDEKDLNLFQYPEYSLKDWQPKNKIAPYSNLSILSIDIETSGLDKLNERIELIGMINSNGVVIIINCLSKPIDTNKILETLNSKYPGKYSKGNLAVFNCDNEKQGLIKFLDILIKKKFDILSFFNGFTFDLPFIIAKLEKYKLHSPFWVNPNQTKFTTAQVFGKPSIYNSVWFNTYPRGKTAVIDLYHQLLSWDFVARKLTKYSLKQGVLQTGLRDEERLELTFEEMRQVVKSGDIETFAEYLIYDLEDTKLLGDYLIPSIYYQKEFLPDWKLQSISHSGNGSKWNDILKKYYLSRGLTLPETSDRCKFQGGLTGANAGLYLNVSKIDVASLYPNIMLTYGICSEKDTDKYQLTLLKYLLNYRLNLKQKKKDKTATSEEKRTEGAYKVIINSGYGSLGTGGIEFNDYVAAALVTAYGRAILRLMFTLIQEYGGNIASVDTDGVYFSTDDPTYQKNLEIHQIVQSRMPKGITLDYELEAKAFYVPPNTTKKIESEIVSGTDEDQSGIRNDGLKKNYIIIDKKGSVKSKGKYAKRDRCKLEKNFQPELVKLLSENKEKAIDYYKSIVEEMKLGVYDLDNLRITRTIRKGEKEILSLGKEGEQISYYFAEPEIVIGKKGKPLKHKKQVKTIDGEPGWSYYIQLVEEMFKEVWQYVK